MTVAARSRFRWDVTCPASCDCRLIGSRVPLFRTTPLLGTLYCSNLLCDRPDWLAFAMSTTRSEEHTSELQSLMRISYAVFCLKKKKKKMKTTLHISN